MNDQQQEALALQLGELALSHNVSIATAESCTGGGLAEVITRIAGSSQWFDRAFVTYSNDAKLDMLDVREHTLEEFGAVSEQTAKEMALGALSQSRADVVVSITGIAGPTGGTKDKPVGTVCFAWADRQEYTQTTSIRFSGDRQSIRKQACLMAMQGLIEIFQRY